MPKQILQLEHAFINHRAKLTYIENLSETLSDNMQELLALELQAFDQLLVHWATAPPARSIISRSNHPNNIP